MSQDSTHSLTKRSKPQRGGLQLSGLEVYCNLPISRRKNKLAWNEVRTSPVWQRWLLARTEAGFPIVVGEAVDSRDFKLVMAENRAGIDHAVGAVINGNQHQMDV